MLVYGNLPLSREWSLIVFNFENAGINAKREVAMNARIFAIVGLATVLFFAGSASADLYDDADRAAGEFLDRYEKLRSLNASENKRLVAAICDAEEADRKSVSRDAAERVERAVGKAYDSMRDLRSRAIDLLKAVQNEQKFKDKHGNVRDKEARINEVWDRVERMRSNGVIGGNNPVAAMMVKMGQEAHSAYQKNSSNCSVSEWRVGSGSADCIKRSTCEVIELKPNNSRSISLGRSQARAYTEVLNKSPDEYNKLVEKDKGFAECKGKFNARVACYQFCPEINDDGSMRSASVGWNFCD